MSVHSSSISSPKTKKTMPSGEDEFPLSPPPRRPSATSGTLRREPPRMEPYKPVEPVFESSDDQPPPPPAARSLHYYPNKHPPPPPLELPPPLPPRKTRAESASSGSEVSPHRLTPTFPTPLPHPPSNDSHASAAAAPPPLPPRRERHRNSELNRQFGMEPLTHTLPGRNARTPYHPNATLTLPRRNSERDYLAAVQPQFVNVNGDRGGSVTPELPPKTYNTHVSHHRQQSS